MTVTGALTSPKVISGRESGFINSPAGTVSAKVSPGKGDKNETPSTVVASATAAVLWQNSRRVICNSGSWDKMPVR